MSYYIKDLESGYGTFMRITSKFELINNSLVNIGDSYIVITIGEEQSQLDTEGTPKQKLNNNNQTLNLKIFSGQTVFDPVYLNP